ncbi:MAG: transcription-repair coupling factor, partial [Rikenellaceae bacterium]|nr:transcription-repair coupling factor [Rikenellaceae bacterium]
KRSIQYGRQDASGIVQRTAALNAVRAFRAKPDGYLIICTYPEALAEKVVELAELQKSTVTVAVGERVGQAFVEQALQEYGFERVDFVHEPGQYAVRGGILDVFSFAENRPFRLDFFGDEVESVRAFDVASQLSVERLERAEIVPNLKDSASVRVSLPEFTGRAAYWIDDLDHTLKRFAAIRTQIIKDGGEVDNLVIGGKTFLAHTEGDRFILRTATAKERQAEAAINFDTAPQPAFNKQFDLLGADIRANAERGYTTYILSENKAQIERLRNILDSTGQRDATFTPVAATLHEGFVSHPMRAAVYTDHQIFDRYHRYRLNKEIDRSEALTIAELNTLKTGDYVVHIDHGVGRFGGLVKTTENGKVQEAVKLVYRDNDVLFVNVHALHRIARYKDRDAEPPKIYKLGSGAWQRMKTATKKAVKDIARELIALYSRRKATPGHAFAPDTYMQHELEASFIYEDTPDQQKATEAVKADMESPRPMDRLVCGDVGFGKTEVAMRAAFKAVSDGKQVAVLVPTTILSLQHYRTFNDRLRDFPVRIEHLSRAKSAKETRHILEELAAGRIDILIGTHKILGKDVKFKDLGLLVIDEEQKFGVSAKEKLRQMSAEVDTLTLTATPIPRTLQFSLMGSRDLSVITTPPPNRYPIQTESHLFDEEIIKEAIEYELARHGQVYFVHNRVKDIGRIEGIIQRLVPKARTVAAHGQLDPTEMERRVMDFIYGEYDVLVATTIIENGIDIPNANTIIINNAHCFGLSDLHQLRGRVGRSNRKAFCYLFTPPDEMLADNARRRLRAIEEFSDLGAGFNIAMQDLDIRGAGNLLGAEQSGFIADIGFETYQKILDEAMDELRAEGLVDNEHVEKDTASQRAVSQNAAASENETRFLSDAHIEIDTEALLPDDYVGSAAEKIKLYRELDNITEEHALQEFSARLTDRFGVPPAPVEELLNVIRMRRVMMAIGFERAKVKNGLMILRFVGDSASAYYKSARFMAILRYVTENPAKFVLKQRDSQLGLTVRGVANTREAYEVLEKLYELS